MLSELTTQEIQDRLLVFVKRRDAIAPNRDRASIFEKDMLNTDIAIFTEELARRKTDV